MTQRLISKSKYCTGLQCPKLLWVNYNDKQRLPPIDSATQRIFDQGHVVGDLAKTLYPDGIEIKFRRSALNDMVAETVDAIKSRKPIFEAAFMKNGAYAQVDILVPDDDDSWNIIEVKSSTKVKDINLDDVAFQLQLCEYSNLTIKRCYVMHISNQYERTGALDTKSLLQKEDVTDEARIRAKTVRNSMESMFQTISSSNCPDVQVGLHCDKPYTCPLKNECWSFLPEDNITTLYWTGLERTLPLIRSGILKVTDLPDDFNLSEKQAIQRRSLLSGKPHIDRESISDFLSSLNYPQYHLDFETFQSAIPLYDNTRPYQQIPFQFSLHIWESSDTEPRHVEFLAAGHGDPRPEILAQLKNHIGPDGSVVAYNMCFEISCLKNSASAFPEYQDFVDGLIPRFADLLRPFQNFSYYHPKQHGSASIKAVLPVLVPELSYKDLEIGDGMTASSEYARIADGNVSSEEEARIRSDLLQYCALDTLAMIRIVQALHRFKSQPMKGAMDYNTHPKNVTEAVDSIINQLPDDDRNTIARMEKGELSNLHFGMGQWIRNNFGLWSPNSPLVIDTGVDHPDDASGVIIEALWCRLRDDESLKESRDMLDKAREAVAKKIDEDSAELMTKEKMIDVICGNLRLKPRDLTVHEERPSNFNVYSTWGNEPCWYVYAVDRSDELLLRSSRVIVVSKRSGKILYDGSAGDEG